MHHEKRSHARVPVDVAVHCELGDGRTVDATVSDISLGGAFVSTEARLDVGAPMTLVVTLPGLAGPARLPAHVRWVRSEGFGVQFGLLGARETHALTDLMRRR